MDLRTLAISAAVAWIAGVAFSWTLAVLRSQRIDLAAAAAALFVYRFSGGFDVVRFAILLGSLVLLATRTRFEEVDRAYGDAARSLGTSEWRLAVRLLPLAWPSILLGLAISFLVIWAAA
jgi:ABC-type nitrate/sulfonate/bicarbonate transport system permease component